VLSIAQYHVLYPPVWSPLCGVPVLELAVAGDKAGLLPPRTRSSAAHTATAAGAPLVGALGAHGDDDAGGGESSGMSLGGRAASGAVPRGMQQV